MRIRYSFSSRKTGKIEGGNAHRKPFPTIVRDLVKLSDIILEVIDARFPDKTRNLELEALVAAKGKKLVYIFNKIDIADVRVVEDYIQEKQTFPYVLTSCSKRAGSRAVRERIKIEAKRLKLNRGVQVAVIGYPNTGKSSLINFLIGRASTPTSQQAGFTKGIQKLKMSTGIFLMDSPGVIPDNEDSASKREDLKKHAEIGVRTYDKVKDVEFVVARIVRDHPNSFDEYFEIEAKGDSEILFEHVGRKNHFLKKGGIVDSVRTARFILKAWQEGKISP